MVPGETGAEPRYDGAGRWIGLFADLEAQLAAADLAEFAAELDTRVRTETSRLRLVDRLRAAVNTELRLTVTGAAEVRGLLRRVGQHWLLIDEGGGNEVLVTMAALSSIRGAGRWSAVPESEGVVESRLGLAHVLRGIARDRAAVRLRLIGGQQLDGTIDRIGRDFLEIATHERDEFRRAAQVRDVQLVAFTGVALVRRGVGAAG